MTVTVALADDLTGREKHEVALNRPPRVTKTYTLEANGEVTFKVPYGGLIYIKGDSKDDVSANFTFTGVVKAPFYKDGEWKKRSGLTGAAGRAGVCVVRLYHAEEEP